MTARIASATALMSLFAPGASGKRKWSEMTKQEQDAAATGLLIALFCSEEDEEEWARRRDAESQIAESAP